MKSKNGGGLFGIFKKKTTPAPIAPPQENSTTTINTTTTDNNTGPSGPPEMPPRKGSIAKTSVIHYSPPGTVRIPSVPSSTVGSADGEENQVVITRKSNIVLEDEESVVSTPVSQYDESPIIHKPRKKKVAPPPPSTHPNFSTQHPQAQQPHHRQQSTSSSLSPVTSSSSTTSSTPPPLPPHGMEKMDYEEMLKKVQIKFEEWNRVRMEDGGSIREERIKAEVLREHEKLRILLEQEMTPSDSSKPKKTLNNNNNIPKKVLPQYGNFYPSPAQTRKVPGGTVYQKTSTSSAQQKTAAPTIVTIPSPKSPKKAKTDENRNEIQYQKTPQKTSPQKIYQKTSGVQNTAAVDRLRKEVEEQRAREKEIKQYRSPKDLPRPESPRKEGPRMVEYKPMKSPGLPEEVEDVAPPIPKTPPPKLSEYRKEQPRMPQVPTNGYVRLQMGGKKTSAPVAPPEYASSPKLLRKVESPKPKEKVYEKPTSPTYQKGMISTIIAGATSSGQKTSPLLSRGTSVDNGYQKMPLSGAATSSGQKTSPLLARGTSVDNGYQKMPLPVVPTSSGQKTSPLPSRGTSVDNGYQKMPPKKSEYQKPPVSVSTDDYRPTKPQHQKTPPIKGDTGYQKIPQKTSTDDYKTTKPQKTSTTVSATSPPYQKTSTLIQIRPPVLPEVPTTPKTEGFDISDVLRGPRLRKVGMPVERSGIPMGKVLDTTETPSSRPTSVPPPPPPPPMATLMSSGASGGAPQKNADLRDSLMSEIREAGLRRAARAAQSA